MPLLDLWKSSPETIAAMSLEQVVNISGNGKLVDNSETSKEFTTYLSQIDTEKLGEYVSYCLSNAFPQSGYVLQDIVNELGRRLEYDVTNGLYSGKKNSIGFDGIWTLQDGLSIVVEVKTTDAYRINLDTIDNYRNRLIKGGQISDKSSILIVVGRQDTGDIEAQIRGSRHAWVIRMISAESLLKIVSLKEASEDEETLSKIRSLLVPFEYTRLDNIIDIVFTTVTDASTSENISADVEASDPNLPVKEKHNKQDRTDVNVIKLIRSKIIDKLGKAKSVGLIAKSKALFWTSDKTVRVACTISKPYTRGSDYWYALHKKWLDFLKEGSEGLYVLGFVDERKFVAIPVTVMEQNIDKYYKTAQNNNLYWHILVDKTADGYSLNIPGGEFVNLSQFTYNYEP
jgi:hypothetical protein